VWRENYKYLEDLNVQKGDTVIIPLMVSGTENLISSDILLRYDSHKIEFLGIDKTYLSEKFQLLYHEEEGELRAVLYGRESIKKEGDLVNIKFKVIGNEGEEGLISLDKFLINENIMQCGSAKVIIEGDLPDDMVLIQNYPNPFNPETTIEVRLKEETFVILTIYNLSGQIVKHLISGMKSAGVHKILWDSRDNNGRFVTSGIYFYKLQKDGKILKKKMILIR